MASSRGHLAVPSAAVTVLKLADIEPPFWYRSQRCNKVISLENRHYQCLDRLTWTFQSGSVHKRSSLPRCRIRGPRPPLRTRRSNEAFFRPQDRGRQPGRRGGHRAGGRRLQLFVVVPVGIVNVVVVRQDQPDLLVL